MCRWKLKNKQRDEELKYGGKGEVKEVSEIIYKNIRHHIQ